MVVLDLNTGVVQVNQSLVRKDYDLFQHIEVPIAPSPEGDQDAAAPAGADAPAAPADAPSGEAAQLVEDGSTSFAHVLWQCITRKK